MGEVKAARERLARKVWRNMREYRDVHTLLDDHARLTAEVRAVQSPRLEGEK